jgi:hypothetical protein
MKREEEQITFEKKASKSLIAPHPSRPPMVSSPVDNNCYFNDMIMEWSLSFS